MPLKGLTVKHKTLYLYLQTSSTFPTLLEGNVGHCIFLSNLFSLFYVMSANFKEEGKLGDLIALLMIVPKNSANISIFFLII